jgi:hypothetical protein
LGTQTESVTFSLYIQPEGGDTRPPLVTFLYPEAGEVIAEEIIETFLVVEEGVRLSTVDIGGVVAHQSVGNFFLIYAAPEAQGANTLTALAKDYTVNLRVKCTSNLRIKVHHSDDDQYHQNGTTRSNHRIKGARLERS